MRRATKGFTLIELMVTMAIVAILAAVAVPSYTNYVRKTRRADAKASLVTIATAMEKYLLQNNSYTTSLTSLSGLGEIDRASGRSPNGMYSLTILAPDASGSWRVQAKAVAGTPQAEDKECQSFEYHLNGTKVAKSGSGTDTTASCWD